MTTGNKPADAAAETDAIPARKRGSFLPGRFFSGKDKEPAPPADEKAGMPEEPPTPEANLPSSPEMPSTRVSKLALQFSPVPESTPPTHSTASEPPLPMSSTDSSRASAQLTFSFEVASLHLTPFFKLGAVQLRALSNVVALHFVGTERTQTPFAAAIAFQIEQVELAGSAGIKSLLLKPLAELRAGTAPQPRLQVGHVALSNGGDAPIAVSISEQTSTPVQVLGTFAVMAVDFTPAFEVESIRLKPTSNTVFVRVVPSVGPGAQDLPPVFEVAEIQTDVNAQLLGVRLVPGAAGNV